MYNENWKERITIKFNNKEGCFNNRKHSSFIIILIKILVCKPNKGA